MSIKRALYIGALSVLACVSAFGTQKRFEASRFGYMLIPRVVERTALLDESNRLTFFEARHRFSVETITWKNASIGRHTTIYYELINNYDYGALGENINRERLSDSYLFESSRIALLYQNIWKIDYEEKGVPLALIIEGGSGATLDYRIFNPAMFETYEAPFYGHTNVEAPRYTSDRVGVFAPKYAILGTIGAEYPMFGAISGRTGMGLQTGVGWDIITGVNYISTFSYELSFNAAQEFYFAFPYGRVALALGVERYWYGYALFAFSRDTPFIFESRFSPFLSFRLDLSLSPLILE